MTIHTNGCVVDSSGSGECLRSAGVEGMKLTSEPVSTRKLVRVCVSLTKKIGDCEWGHEQLSPRVSSLGVSPSVRLLTLLGSFTIGVMVPAKGVGILVLVLRVIESWTSRAIISGMTTASSSWAALGESGNQVFKA